MFRIFLVEDDLNFCTLLTDLLTVFPHVEVPHCETTESSAIDWLVGHAGEWNIAIVDLTLARGSGLRVLSACRVRHPHQKMLVLSNHVTGDMRRRCLMLGADAVFDKGTDIEALLDYCRTASANASPRHDTDFLKF